MQPDNFGYQQATISRSGANVDAGLRAHMQSVYNRMTGGVAITGLTAWLVSQSPALLQFFMGGPQMSGTTMWSNAPRTLPSARYGEGCTERKTYQSRRGTGTDRTCGRRAR